MDAVRVAQTLNAYWPVRSGYDPTPQRGSGRDPLGAVIAEKRAGYPYPTTSQFGGVPPVLYVGDTAHPAHPDAVPNRRRLADHPHTADRPPLVLPDPALLRFARNPLLRSHYAATLALTALDTADALDAIASESGQPKRAFTREAHTYRDAAAQYEDLLDDYAKPWIDEAEQAIAASGQPPAPAVNRIPSQRMPHVPISL